MPPQYSEQSLPSDVVDRVDRCVDLRAQTSAANLPAVDLPTAVQWALCRQPKARQSWLSALVQGAQLGQSKAAYLPQVNAAISRSRQEVRSTFDQPLKSSTESTVLATSRRVTLSMLLLDAGTRSSQIEEAAQLLNAALASHDAALQEVFATTAQAYYELLSAHASLDAATLAQQVAAQNHQAAQDKRRAGIGTLAEVYQAHAALSQAVLATVRAQGEVSTARAVLAVAMGLDAQAHLQVTQVSPDSAADPVAGPIKAQAAEVMAQFDSLLEEAKQKHPAILAAQAQLQAAYAKRSSLINEGRPSVSLNVGRYLNGRPEQSLSPIKTSETTTAITVNIPLFEGFARDYKVQEADAVVQARQADLADTQAQVGLDIWRNYQTLLLETSSLQASLDLMQSTQQSYQAAQARYQKGAGDMLELLTAQKDQASARQERIRTLTAWRTARLKLLGSLGQLGFWALSPP